MGTMIKILLIELGKKQVDLLKELKKRGYKNLYSSQLSNYINGVENTPQAESVLAAVHEILDEWKKERN